jgi:hypothetical protein
MATKMVLKRCMTRVTTLTAFPPWLRDLRTHAGMLPEQRVSHPRGATEPWSCHCAEGMSRAVLEQKMPPRTQSTSMRRIVRHPKCNPRFLKIFSSVGFGKLAPTVLRSIPEQREIRFVSDSDHRRLMPTLVMLKLRMGRLAKFVAALLVVLTAMPALAGVVLCPQAMHSMKCCSSECPMMAKTTGAKVAGRTGPEINGPVCYSSASRIETSLNGPVCCSPASRTATPLVEQRATKRGTHLATLHRYVTDVGIRVTDMRTLTVLRESPPRFRPSRTALCSFLI